MPILDWTAPGPHRPKRILVAGPTGAGKSTFARKIAVDFELPYTELDALYHGAGWTPRPSFHDDVVALAARDTWITEWQYPVARPLLADRADLMLFLDLPRWRVTYQVVRRTLGRAIRRTELWNGCREAPLRTIFRDPNQVIRWSVRTQPEHAPRVRDLSERLPDLPIVWFTSQSELRQWAATRLKSSH